jgi:hypothetical protein
MQYHVFYCFTVDAENRFDATRKVETFLPENPEGIEYFPMEASRVHSKENCGDCIELDDYGCMWHVHSPLGCKKDPLIPKSEFALKSDLEGKS